MVDTPVPTATEDPPLSPTEPTRRKGGLGRLFLIGLILLAVGAWFLPSIAGQMWSKTDVTQLLGTDLPASVQFDNASLSWQAPVLLRDVAISDRHGRVSANIGAVTTGQTLWQLVTNKTQPLSLTFEGLSATVVVPNGSLSGSPQLSLEQTLDLILKQQVPALPRALKVQLSGGTITFVDPQQHTLAILGEIGGTYEFAPASSDNSTSHAVDLQARVTQPKTGGVVKVKGDYHAAGPSRPAETLLLGLRGDHFPLDPLQPLTASFFGGKLITGAADANTLLDLRRDPNGMLAAELTGQLTRPEEASLDLVPVLQAADGTTEPLDVDPITWSLKASYDQQSDQFQVPQLKLASVPISVDGSGTIEQASGPAIVDVQGTLRCDAQELFDQLPL
ncbi:MAG: DUF748 domain-containing protein, partial [Planctomycetaceae bacterium]|nr:DUF748 domain-containing protein [Planctomycetaceae bacterium]